MTPKRTPPQRLVKTGSHPTTQTRAAAVPGRPGGARFWAFVSGGGAVFVGAVHSGPAAVEPPELILDGYDSPILGWLAFALLVTFVTVLAITSLCETGSGGSTEGDAEAAALVAFGRSQSSRQALAPAIGRDPSLPVLVAHAGHRLNRS